MVRWWSLALVWVWTLGVAGAGPSAMVTRLVEGGEVVVNRGLEDEMTPGTRLTAVRQGRHVAEVEVTLVDTYSSRARVVQGGGVAVGDLLEQAPFDPSRALPEALPRVVAGGVAPASSTAALEPLTEGDMKQAAGRLEDVRGRLTQSRSFVGGRSSVGDTGKASWSDAVSLLNLITAIGHGGGNVASWQVVTSVLGDQANTRTTNKRLYQKGQLEVQVTWWDEALLNSFADSVAVQDGQTSLDQRLALRSNLAAQKGLDRFLVFQVRLINHGAGTLHLSPFHWHLYLVDAQGNRVKAERYDQVLDKTLNPEQSVEGFIYFQKADPNGQSASSPGKVKIALEDIMGEKAEMTFVTPRR